MRFDVVGLARPRTPRDDALRVGAKHGDSVNDGCNHVAEQQDQAWQDTQHEGGGVGTVALLRACGEVGMFGAGSAHQGGDVVGQHLGRHVDDQGLLRQPGNGFEFEALLEAFKCLLDAPLLVVEVCIHGVPAHKIVQRVVGGIASSGGWLCSPWAGFSP